LIADFAPRSIEQEAALPRIFKNIFFYIQASMGVQGIRWPTFSDSLSATSCAFFAHLVFRKENV
jgi:hypothetical protein